MQYQAPEREMKRDLVGREEGGHWRGEAGERGGGGERGLKREREGVH